MGRKNNPAFYHVFLLPRGPLKAAEHCTRAGKRSWPGPPANKGKPSWPVSFPLQKNMAEHTRAPAPLRPPLLGRLRRSPRAPPLITPARCKRRPDWLSPPGPLRPANCLTAAPRYPPKSPRRGQTAPSPTKPPWEGRGGEGSGGRGRRRPAPPAWLGPRRNGSALLIGCRAPFIRSVPPALNGEIDTL